MGEKKEGLGIVCETGSEAVNRVQRTENKVQRIDPGLEKGQRVDVVGRSLRSLLRCAVA